jgi:hypothetical protein
MIESFTGIRPEVWSIDKLLGADLGKTVLFVSPKVLPLVRTRLNHPISESLDKLPPDIDTLIVIGGGTRIDMAKAWRFNNPGVRLVVIPSIWGSGAEASPVVVLNEDGKKKILIDDKYLPDVRCVWPELAKSVTDIMAKHACGDSWAHALEGFLSPLADDTLRSNLAALLKEMTELPLANNPIWFEPSARASSGQAHSSTGLVHGIAHVLEGPLSREHQESQWGHAKLCSIFLWPVMKFNRSASGKFNELMNKYNINADAIFGILEDLFDANSYEEALPSLKKMWKEVLKNPMTRTNSVLVRPGTLEQLTGTDVQTGRLITSDNPYGPRDDTALLEELNALTKHHLKGCPQYSLIWPGWKEVGSIEEIPYLHVGIFKHTDLKTTGPGVSHERTLKSSATTTGVSSMISLDRRSSEQQARSTLAILKDFVGDKVRPLLVLDSAQSLRSRTDISARIAAAMSLRPLSSEIRFLLDNSDDPTSMKWDALTEILSRHDDLLVYGLTWLLWLSWGNADFPENVRRAFEGKRIHFVHSGGWKKLEELSVDHATFDRALLRELSPKSKVIDFYGLVEQVGIIYPMCEQGYRHVPAWADVIVRDPFTLDSLVGKSGQLQLLNSLALGAPYHSVLTEDIGTLIKGDCPCGRPGKRFLLEGRMARAEVRGCANV